MRKPHSFDIFDTLIARRCIESHNIFKEMEKNIKLDGFANLRVQAEAHLSTGSYSIDDIYLYIEDKYKINHDVTELLKKIEIDTEINNVIGIKQNLEQVHNGDILISDMYLSPDVILKLLNKAGLDKQVGIIVSNSGKKDGDVWPKLKGMVCIEQHSGDNLHADVNSPMTHGLFAEHCLASALTPYEVFFRDNGFETLARTVREVRLGTISNCDGNEINQQKLIQININIPILIMFSVFLKMEIKKQGLSNVLFSSRDCYNLYRLFSFFNDKCQWNIPSHYFYTSRISRVSPSDSYIKYFNNLATSDSAVIDLCGTGWSLGHLYERVGFYPNTYLLHDLSDTSGVKVEYEKIKKSNHNITITSLVSNSVLNNACLEQVNYIDSGMLLDVLVLDGVCSMIPVFENPNYPEKVMKVIKNMDVVHKSFFDTLDKNDVALLVDEIERGSNKIHGMVNELYGNLVSNMSSMHDISSYHAMQDRKSMWKLQK